MDLFSCDVSNSDGYRDKVFELIPHLKYLDGFDKECAEAEESDEEYGRV